MEKDNKGMIIGLMVVLVLVVFYLFLRFQGSPDDNVNEDLSATDVEMVSENEINEELMTTDDLLGDAASREAMTAEPAGETPDYMQPQPPVSLTEPQNAQLSLGASDREPTSLTFDVSGGSFYYVPNMIRVQEGDRVKIVLTNVGGTHDLVIPDFDVRTEITRTGESSVVEFTADKKGSFEFYCSVGNGYHRDMGQIGTLLVE